MQADIKSLCRNQLWSTRSICIEFFGTTSPSNLKKTERWLAAQKLNHSPLNQNTINDEHGRSAKALVAEQIIDNAKKKRKLVLFAKFYSAEIGILFTNDGRKGRRWIFFNSSNPSFDELQSALELLVSTEKKDTMIFPSGPLVCLFRELARQWKSNEIKISGRYRLRLVLEIYSHGLGDVHNCFKDKLQPEKQAKGTHLDHLEAEAIHILREVASEAVNPVMLYSIGKDSQVLLHLARKAFYPSPIPFSFLHIDTKWKFQAMYDFRDFVANEAGIDFLVHTNSEGLKKNINPFDHGSEIHTHIMKTESLKCAIEKYDFDVAIGGARRDEEKSRAKERIFSFRSSSHRWDPKNQRPELWRHYNLQKNKGESIRAFPISNWTELDVWLYIYREQIPVVPLYFAAERPVVIRDDLLIMVDDDRFRLREGEKIIIKKIRFRSLGCYPLSGAIESDADDLSAVILEILSEKSSERVGRVIDNDTSSSMEKKKHEGYF